MWQWILFAAAAMIVGMSKCGIPGIGILIVVLFQHALLAKEATGFGLPVLIMGDFCAALLYRKHAEWPLILRLAPWAAAGVVGGYFALRGMDHDLAGLVIALMLAAMLILHLMKEWQNRSLESAAEHGPWVAPMVGFAAGFTSMVGNAAGPLMVFYMLSMRFPKMKFMGLGVYFFLLFNLFKLPFLADLELITWGSMGANLKLAPFVVAGGAIGWGFAQKARQAWFDRTAFWLSALAVAHLLWKALSRYAA